MYEASSKATYFTQESLSFQIPLYLVHLHTAQPLHGVSQTIPIVKRKELHISFM